MLSAFKHKILQIRKAHGIEISLLPDGKMMAYAVTLRLEKNRIIKEREFQVLGATGELLKKLEPGCPVAVTVNGKGVLHKKISPEVPENQRFETVLPNANPAGFYLETEPYESCLSVAIVRKEVLDKIVEDLSRLKFRILSVRIGSGGVRWILPYVNANGNSMLRSNHYAFHLSGTGEVTDLESFTPDGEKGSQKVEYSVGDQYVYSTGLLAFASAIELFAGMPVSGPWAANGGIHSAAIEKEKENYRDLKYFRAAGRALLAFLFTILLVNFLVYNHYFSKNRELQASRLVNQDEIRHTEQLRTAVDAKDRFFRQHGWDHFPRLSFYADRIAGLLPEGAVLSGMQLFPLNANTLYADGSMPHFKNDTIRITGSCEDPTELTRFANNLRDIPDFKEVDIRSYLYKKETASGIFIIEIITT
jgi:hypothetical protein